MPAPFKIASTPRYTKLSAQFELITPAFVGSFDHACVGLDPKSIKAALRFWWRALNAGHIAHNCSNSELLHDLHQREMRLFGVEGSESAGGQGLLHLVLKSKAFDTKDIDLNAGITYLLGLGLAKYNAIKKCPELLRKPLVEHKFSLELIFFKPGADAPSAAEVESIKEALIAFGLLGGLGARKNRGFGSVALLELDGQKFAATFEEYEAQVKKIFARQHPQLPLLPSVSQHARCRIVHAQDGVSIPAFALKNGPQDVTQRAKQHPKINTAMEMLKLVGEQFMLERSWGRSANPNTPHKTSGDYIAEQNYEPDHDFIKAASNASGYPQPPANAVPLRSIYGLPYRFDKKNEMNLRLSLDGKDSEPTRRGSPFHIHIHKLAGKPLAVLYTLPSQFLPEGQQIEMGEYLPRRHTSSVQFSYRTIDNFLQRFYSAHTVK